MATRRQRYNDLAAKQDRSAGEEGEYNDLKTEMESGNGRFLDEAGHDPSSENPAVPQTTTGEVAQDTQDNPDVVTGEPELTAGKKKSNKK